LRSAEDPKAVKAAGCKGIALALGMSDSKVVDHRHFRVRRTGRILY
jgi:hypothetical protein